MVGLVGGWEKSHLISELIDSKTQWATLYHDGRPCWATRFPCWVLNQLQSPPKLSNVWKWLCVFFYKIHLHVWSPSNLHIVHATKYWLWWGWSWRILCRWDVIVSLCRVSGPGPSSWLLSIISSHTAVIFHSLKGSPRLLSPPQSCNTMKHSGCCLLPLIMLLKS